MENTKQWMGMPLYDMEMEEYDEESGMNKISFVKHPATKMPFFAFNDNLMEVKFAVSNEMDREVTGVVILADTPIERMKDGKKFAIQFRPDVIKMMRDKFFRNRETQNVNIEHLEGSDVQGVYLVESWIIDTKKGKPAPEYLKGTPEGSLIATYKVENDAMWEMVLDGTFEGFSLEGHFGASLAMSEESYIFSEEDKRTLLERLATRGQKTPDNWKLIHSEICGHEEDSFDCEPLIQKLSQDNGIDLNLAVDVVSNPNEPSSLDKGVIRVRYKYVIHPDHSGESLVKENSREFCIALVNQDKIFRREDINQMSFKGANPISSVNYSIFRLKGHWNCRHAWERQIYLIEQQPQNVKANPLVSTETLLKSNMKDRTVLKNFLAKLGKLFTDEKTTLSKEDFEAATADLNLADFAAGENILRVEGDDIMEGATVLWVDAEGETSEVPDGEINLDNGVTVVIKDGAVESFQTAEEVAQEAEAEFKAELAKVQDLATRLKALEDKTGPEVDEAAVSKIVQAKIEEVETKLSAEIKQLPAFMKENFQAKLSATTKKKGTLIERLAANKK